jgi:hypothetical protein
MKHHIFLLLLSSIAFLSCNHKTAHTTDLIEETVSNESIKTEQIAETQAIVPYDTAIKTIHILVALCDNFYQGIVPVPEGIGNGQDPRNNLYWGCRYGVKTFFKRSAAWQLLKTQSIDSIILERLVFINKNNGTYLVADAYNGKYIKDCTRDFLLSSCGRQKDTIHFKGKNLGIAGNAQLMAYIGHNGLMDFDIPGDFSNTDGVKRDVMMLACSSRHYFEQKFDQEYVQPIVWTKALMAPEAYTIHDAIDVYLQEKPDSMILDAAISAYAKYQKCGKRGAASILVSGY